MIADFLLNDTGDWGNLADAPMLGGRERATVAVAEQLAARTDLSAAALAAFGRNMWDHPFVFGVDRDFVRGCQTPCLLLPGTDIPHPAATSTELVALLPAVEVLKDWRGPAHLPEQERRVLAFLRQHCV